MKLTINKILFAFTIAYNLSQLPAPAMASGYSVPFLPATANMRSYLAAFSSILPTSTQTKLIPLTTAGVISAVQFTQSNSPLGTATLSVLKNGTVTVLSTATYDMTTAGSGLTNVSLPLSTTPANLTCAVGDVLQVNVTTGLLTLAPTNPAVVIDYQPTYGQ